MQQITDFQLDLQVQLRSLQRKCYSLIYGTDSVIKTQITNYEGMGPYECFTDKDCAELNTTCHLGAQRCYISREWQEDRFIACIMDNLEKSSQDSIMTAFNLPSYESGNFLSAFKNITSIQSPLCYPLSGEGGFNLKYQTAITQYSTLFTLLTLTFIASIFCPEECDGQTGFVYNSIGKSFQLDQDTCLDNCFWYVNEDFHDPGACSASRICNWDENLCDQYQFPMSTDDSKIYAQFSLIV